MRRWDNLVGSYLTQSEARGLGQETLRARRSQLDRLGCWLERRRPRRELEEVEGQLLIKYLKGRSHFRSRATLAGLASTVRCFGEYLMEAGVWAQNPMRWVRGPRMDPRGRLPRRIGREQLGKIWEVAGQLRGQSAGSDRRKLRNS